MVFLGAVGSPEPCIIRLPRKLSHVVLDTPNIAETMTFYTERLGFRLSDWLENRMCFLRCSADHHSLTLTRRGHAGPNHMSFEMGGLDEYMRGTGRLIRARREPLWGPGRHSAVTTSIPTSQGRTTSSSSTRPHSNASRTRRPGSRGSGRRATTPPTAGAPRARARTCSPCSIAARPTPACGPRHRSDPAGETMNDHSAARQGWSAHSGR
ncbi:hypothetical protein FNH05_02485 [Amycolatopsis rhizosphaerae]|uniref:VOC domain-containing protein n=1 Tax=Amycolatopsis rhizosphaerae TaxID=2053003 RepID=A0A558DKT9_9PSEU|nr:hypothetical protein FNH05_02485 [Amycolatopsis rhizosphaerae]